VNYFFMDSVAHVRAIHHLVGKTLYDLGGGDFGGGGNFGGGGEALSTIWEVRHIPIYLQVCVSFGNFEPEAALSKKSIRPLLSGSEGRYGI
jgi:hypothetical protein